MTSCISVNEELNVIKQVLQNYPNGALIEEIEIRANLGLNRRTLQRRIARLKELKAIQVIGKGRATRYCLIEADAGSTTTGTDDVLVPLSTAGKKVLSFVNQPVQLRRPIGYNPEFLHKYQPNISSYLDQSELDELAEIGKTAMPDRPAGTYAKEILSRLLIDLSWNSSRLEGNTYSLLDTQRLLTFGEVAEGKSAIDAQMILNHKDAIEFLVQSVEDIGFNRYTILNLHALLANNLLPDPNAPGRLRSQLVGIAQSVFEPLAVPQQIAEYFDLLLAKAADIKNPFEQAFFVMVQLPYLQPFDDVNKRVSRLAANIPLIRNNLSPLSFVEMPDRTYVQGMLAVYELNQIDLLKDVFIWAYGRSAARYAALRQSLGEPDPFRLRYRNAMRTLIADVVISGMGQKTAAIKIASQAQELPKTEQARFIEVVETELLALHEGNFARYQVRPSEFQRWQKIWKTEK